MISPVEIYDLISMKQEGGYWDFKRQWYGEGHEGDLLHDIICLANNLENRDAYIIIGVDEENNYKPYDISEDVGKRSTQNIVDFLRDKKFAGDVRPTVTVEHIQIASYDLDVIIVHNSTSTPYYLKENYRQVKANSIYTRVQDANTPVDKSSDLAHVEYLWKKRFGLILSPLERVQALLRDKENWVSCSGYEEILQYYKYAPEYTIGYPIEDPEGRDGYEFFFLNQTDNRPKWTIIQIKYHQTVLFEVDGIMLDGGRHFSPCPLLDGVSRKHGPWDVSYDYFVKGSLEYDIHEFYLNHNQQEALWSDQRLMDNILLFETEEEHQLFNWYLENHWCNREAYLGDIPEPYVKEIDGYNTECFKEQIVNAKIMQKMLTELRNENSGLLQ